MGSGGLTRPLTLGILGAANTLFIGFALYYGLNRDNMNRDNKGAHQGTANGTADIEL